MPAFDRMRPGWLSRLPTGANLSSHNPNERTALMLDARRYLPLGLAFGLAFGALNRRVVFGQESHGQHDHQAMMAEKEISSELAALSSGDRALAKAQRFCPIIVRNRLGAMGTPIKVTVQGQPVFVCCEECVEDATKGGRATLETAQKLTDVSAHLAKLPSENRAEVEAQKFCAVANNNFLGSMGVPVKLQIDGKFVFLCCKGCLKKAQANPVATLAKVEELRKVGMHDRDRHEHADGRGDHRH